MYNVAPSKSDEVMVALSVIFFSSAHCCLAESICFMLAMQVFCRATLRARTKFGNAIAAKRPMMATTIMISTRVKPDFREDWLGILFDFCWLLCSMRVSEMQRELKK